MNYLELVEQTGETNKIAHLKEEVCLIFYLNDSGKIKSFCRTSGNFAGVKIPQVSDIIAKCTYYKCTKIVLVHNHPYVCGKCSSKPSGIDIRSTRLYAKWLKQQGVDLADHIILSPAGSFSFHQHNLFKKTFRDSLATLLNLISRCTKVLLNQLNPPT
ncbi:MAG TPA: JAB domain-containing protein [Verrucomicrobiae bacterium]|nr:JAB domain-containing protein [Verrucomicrobiae bacterium]